MTDIQKVLERYNIPRTTMAYPCAMSAQHVIRFSTDGWTFGKVVSIPQQKKPTERHGTESHFYGFADQIGCLYNDHGEAMEPMRNIWFKSSAQIRTPLRIGPVVFDSGQRVGEFPSVGSVVVGKTLPNTKRTGYKYEWWCANGEEMLWFLRYKANKTTERPLRTANLWILAQIIYHNDVEILVDQYVPTDGTTLPCNRMRNSTPHAFALELSKMCNRPHLFECFVVACDRRIVVCPDILQSPLYPNPSELEVIHKEHSYARCTSKVDRCFVG